MCYSPSTERLEQPCSAEDAWPKSGPFVSATVAVTSSLLRACLTPHTPLPITSLLLIDRLTSWLPVTLILLTIEFSIKVSMTGPFHRGDMGSPVFSWVTFSACLPLLRRDVHAPLPDVGVHDTAFATLPEARHIHYPSCLGTYSRR